MLVDVDQIIRTTDQIIRTTVHALLRRRLWVSRDQNQWRIQGGGGLFHGE